jgi:hypothetical protein
MKSFAIFPFMKESRQPIIVVGGGGSGLVAAERAASLGAHVLLLERTPRLGTKLLVSGGGKCNITHAGEIEELLTAFRPHERRFLKPSFYRFSNRDILHLLEDEGVPSFTRPDGRVFPASGRARDIVGAFARRMKRVGVDIRLRTPADGLLLSEGSVSGVQIGPVQHRASLVILATGGASYSKTGTTGDGYRWLRTCGHTIAPIRPALAPIAIEPPLPVEWRGVAIRDGQLSAYASGRKIAQWKGDILFTHEGISGPAALEISAAAAASMDAGPVDIYFDFFPHVEERALDATFTETMRVNSGKQISSILEAWLPNRIVPFLLSLVRVPADQRAYCLIREKRRSIIAFLKHWHLGTVSRIDLERGEVTAGGVVLSEVDPHTMRSRKIPGLYLCGEVLDIDGPVGGYNLQAAFSTGFVAGEAAAREWLQSGGNAAEL